MQNSVLSSVLPDNRENGGKPNSEGKSGNREKEGWEKQWMGRGKRVEMTVFSIILL